MPWFILKDGPEVHEIYYESLRVSHAWLRTFALLPLEIDTAISSKFQLLPNLQLWAQGWDGKLPRGTAQPQFSNSKYDLMYYLMCSIVTKWVMHLWRIWWVDNHLVFTSRISIKAPFPFNDSFPPWISIWHERFTSLSHIHLCCGLDWARHVVIIAKQPN